MSSLPILYNSSMLSIPTLKKGAAAAHRLPKINDINGRSVVRIPSNTTRRLVFRTSAIMVDDTSSSIKEAPRPPITSFTPNVWGDIFSTFSVDDKAQQKYSEEIEKLKEEARSMLMAVMSTKDVLILIDKLERLGLAYHFETEIQDKLKKVYDSMDQDAEEDYDLLTTALRFRLLRQHRYHVSCDTFERFMDKDNRLKESFSSDVVGLLSLYEAAHVRIHDENILDEAVAFTRNHLSRMHPQLDSPLKKQVQHALQYSIHKTPIIFFLRSNIDMYENDESRDEIVLRLAKVNFNFMQNIYRDELLEVGSWWNKFDVIQNMPYTRDRLVEGYVWTLGHYYEPQYTLLRRLVGKYYMYGTALDDTYDNYATLEEIEILTQAFERWNEKEIDLLRDEHLKVMYKFTLAFAQEVEDVAIKQGKAYTVPYFIEAMKEGIRGYTQERRWCMKGEMPSFKEYVMNARKTAFMHVAYMLVTTTLKSTTKETLKWLLSDDCHIYAYSTDIIRLSDDIAGHQRESKDGAMLTGLDYYMKEKGVCLEEAKSAIKDMIEDKWKHLNALWVNSTTTDQPKDMLVQFLDFTGACEVYYTNEHDHFTDPHKILIPLITALLKDPMPL